MNTTKIHAQFQGKNYTTVINNGNHQITADEPKKDGGEDKGFNPFELILAGLATCTIATVKIYADRKAWDIKKIDIALAMTDNEKAIKMEITIDGAISEEQKARLLVIAKKCPVHKLLSMGTSIETLLN